MKKYLYAAYGMNTNVVQMASRCPRAVSLGHAVLPGYEFRFARHADIVPNAGSHIDVVLWEITEECLASLDLLESYPLYYNRITVPVKIGDQILDTLVYIMNEGYPDEAPSEYYHKMLVDGYTSHRVPLDQINRALQVAKI